MSFLLECKKIKRTGFLQIFLFGGMLAAALPVANMALREEIYTRLHGTPVQVLLNANWQLMAMFNVLLIVTGTCLLYHIEYDGNAIQKIKSLPVSESSVFLGKAVMAVFMYAAVLVIEAGAVIFCSCNWFVAGNGFWTELCQGFVYTFILALPCTILSLLVSEACRNMWISLGTGVVCVCTAVILPEEPVFLSFFPFSMPFRILSGTEHAAKYICAAVVWIAIAGVAQLVFVKARRCFR